MENKWSVVLTLAFTLVLVNCDVSSAQPGPKNGNHEMEGCPLCHTRGPPKCCELLLKAQMPFNPSRCCGGAVHDYFQSSQFENIFSKRKSLEAHAAAPVWDYHSFITASAYYQPYGFGTTYMNGKFSGKKEVAAFLAHVGTKTSYEFRHYNTTYPCANGVAYYGRGALPIYWNYNYGEAGKALKVDLLNHPEYIEQNATLHMMSLYWKPTKNDTLAKRVSGFGSLDFNMLYGDLVCGEDDNESMNNIISHYLYYLDLMGVCREEAGPHEVLSCAQQVAFNPFSSSSP
ncbi:chitinase-like protein 2 [Fagus crenata]